MIRTTTTLLAVGFFTLSGLTAMAAPARHTKATTVAVATEGAAPAGDTKTEKTDKVEKKSGKSTKGGATKEKGTEGTTAPAPAPAGEKMPEKK